MKNIWHDLISNVVRLTHKIINMKQQRVWTKQSGNSIKSCQVGLKIKIENFRCRPNFYPYYLGHGMHAPIQNSTNELHKENHRKKLYILKEN